MDGTNYELVVFDGDETLIDGDVISALAEHSSVTSEVERIKADVWRNDLDAMEALEDHIFPLFEGVSVAEIDQVVRSLRFAPGARTVARNVTCQTAIFTALTPLADRIADELGFDWTRANDPVIDGEELTGALRGDIVTNGKGPVLDDLVEQLDLEYEQVIAIGDGPHDEPLFTRAGFSIGMDPKPSVRDVPDVVIDEQDFHRTIPYLRDRGVLDAAAVSDPSGDC